MTALRKTTAALISDAAPFAIRAERASDVAAREALLDACFGDNRHTRTCQRLRDGRAPAEGLALSAVRQGRVVGSVRLWHVSAGGIPALMLGPLAVEASSRQLGVGAALMDHALAAAKTLVAEGFQVMAYCSDDPIMAKSLEDLGCVAVMPLASLIGSGMGILNPWNLQLVIEKIKVPVLVDAGVGTASDATLERGIEVLRRLARRK